MRTSKALMRAAKTDTNTLRTTGDAEKGDSRIELLFPRASAAAQLASAMHLVAEEIEAKIKADRENVDRPAWELAYSLLIAGAENLKAEAMGLLGIEAEHAMKQLSEVTGHVNRTVEEIKDVQQLLEVATALLRVVGSFAAGLPLEALASLTALKKLLPGPVVTS